MRAQVIRGGAAARMMHDEADVEVGRVRRAFPRVAEQPRLIVGRQRFRFADVNLRRSEPQRGFDDRVEDVDARAQSAAAPAGPPARPARPPPRAAGARRRSCAAAADGSSGDVDADQPDGHGDDVAVAGGAQRGGQVRQRAGLPHRHEHVARPRLDVREILVAGRQQLKLVERARRRLRMRRGGSLGDRRGASSRRQQRDAGNGRRVERDQAGTAPAAPAAPRPATARPATRGRRRRR